MADPSSVCPHCGGALPEDVLVCPTCHTPVDVAPLPPEPSTAEPAFPPSGPAPSESAGTEALPEPALEPPTPGPMDPPLVPLPPDPLPPLPEPAPAAGNRGRASLKPSIRRGATAPANPFASELTRRLARVAQWIEGAEPLGVQIPKLPAWAEEAARTSWNPEPWAEAVRGIERIAQKRIVAGFEEWQKRTKARLTRLEAYAVDSRLERDQIEDTLHAARTGDIAQALSTFQQVDRVVSLKERHLDQAREELERVVALLRDMQALGVDPPQDPTAVEDELESELRAGKLAPLKQQIRALRLQAVNRLKAGLPRYISEYGDYLLDERSHGIATELEATELARGAREFFRGHPEEGLRRLRALQQTHGVPPGRSTHSTVVRR
jgi:hypothetical protein